MSHPPIRPCCEVRPSSADRSRARREAERLRSDQPRLSYTGEMARLRCRDLRPASVLHLDDTSDISLPSWRGSMDFLEDRARLRAGDGDHVATRIRPVPGYEDYCRTHLGLGRVRWVRARADRRNLAAACWIDPKAREALCRADFTYVHPHMGSFAVWALSDLVQRSARRDIQVIAPPPGLCAAANNKLWVADVARRLLGEARIPRSHPAANLSTMAAIVRELASEAARIVVKVPDSVGGGGNLVLDAAPFRKLDLGGIRGLLRERLSPLEWQGDVSLLVGCWESDVLAAPSVQTWIPPLGQGDPIVEGLFEQIIEGREGLFVGTRPARLAEALSDQAIHESWLLAYTFQHLGYVGRCSFDLILVGEERSRARLEFVECNARWGGTSLPMTLVHRLGGARPLRHYACRDCDVGPMREGTEGFVPEGTEGLVFNELLAHLGPELYDRRSNRATNKATNKEGNIVLFNPAALRRGEIATIGLGKRYFETPDRLAARLCQWRRASGPSGAAPARPPRGRSAA